MLARDVYAKVCANYGDLGYYFLRCSVRVRNQH
jgi:hypothetical protein